MINKYIVVFPSVFFLYTKALAQPVKYTNAINASGGTANIGTNNHEWSVGEMVLVNTGTASNIIVTQGVLQPAQSSGNVGGHTDIMKNVSLYPVPTKSIVYLQYNFHIEGKLHYELMDIAGKMILQKDVEVLPGSHRQEIDLENLPNASYMLHLIYRTTDNVRTATSFKLDKIN